MKNAIRLNLILLFSVMIVACGGGKGVKGPSPEVIDINSRPSTAPFDGQGGIVGENLNENDSLIGTVDDPLNQRMIYFEYDSSLLNPKNEAIIRAHAQYLLQTPGVKVILEGHADERGTREYNLALGEDRAKETTRIMQALGVSLSRIQTISYGEERPISLEHTESGWSQNRRVEILYR